MSDWPYPGFERVGVDYGRVWHLAPERTRFAVESPLTLCGQQQVDWNRPRTDRICKRCALLTEDPK